MSEETLNGADGIECPGCGKVTRDLCEIVDYNDGASWSFWCSWCDVEIDVSTSASWTFVARVVEPEEGQPTPRT